MLDGIGKSLDPRFDISEISAPYARCAPPGQVSVAAVSTSRLFCRPPRELLLEGNPVFAKYLVDLKKRSDNQNRAVVNLFKGPNNIEEIASTITRLERGDLKLRVRALEV